MNKMGRLITSELIELAEKYPDQFRKRIHRPVREQTKQTPIKIPTYHLTYQATKRGARAYFITNLNVISFIRGIN